MGGQPAVELDTVDDVGMDAIAGGLAQCRHRLHNDYMPSITVRNVPADVRDELAARAARAGRSLQEHLRAELVELAGKPTVDELMARVRARKEATGSRLPAARILGHRDKDRR